MKISLGESRPKKFKLFSWATQKVEGVDHSHVFVSWKDEDGLRWVAEARGSGIRLVSNKTFKRDSEVVNIYQYPCSAADYQKVITYVWSQSGNEYGFGQILGLLLMRVGNAFARYMDGAAWFGNPFTDGNKSQICCEFALNIAGITSNDIDVPKYIENYGLIETRQFNIENGTKAPQSKIDAINGKTA